MIGVEVNKEKFKFKYLPDYASFLLDNQLEEFVRVGIRYSREEDLPLLKPLSKYSEGELVQLSLASNREVLEALGRNAIGDYIETNILKWVSNTLEVIDKNDVVAEDLTLLFFVRRKLFSYFLDTYTQNVYLHRSIIEEVDRYTTQEELISYNIFIKMQREELELLNEELTFHTELFQEAQSLGEYGSYMFNFTDEAKSFNSPEYQRILELTDNITLNDFMEWVHPEDRSKLKNAIDIACQQGGKFEVEYRYQKGGHVKRIWSKGFTVSEEGKPILMRGIIKEIT